MAYVEVDEAGEPILNEDGEKNVIDSLDMGGWDHVKNQIPDEFKEDKHWENIPDTATLLKNHIHLQKKIGEKEEGSFKVPGEGATPEDWTDVFTKLGRPESLEGYEGVFKEAPAGGEWDETVQRGFLDASHKAGLNPQQAEILVNWYSDWQKDIAITGDRILGDAEANLRSEWGPNYDVNISLATRAAAKLGGQEYLDLMDVSGYGNHPEVVKAWTRVGRVLAEDNIIPAEVDGVATGAQAKAKIAEIQGDPKHLYHSGDKEAQKEMRKLFQIAYPETR